MLSFDKLYFIEFFEQYFGAAKADKQILDFGCGMGEIIFSARSKGYAFWGVDNYYNNDLPGYDHDHLELSIKEYIKLIDPSGNCPFEDHFFDFIYSNQVFEHIDNIQQTLNELDRILKPGGIMIHNFPCKELWNEAHFAVPFIHQISHQKARYHLLNFYYNLGLGLHRKSKRKKEWLENALNFIDESCYYRPEKVLLKHFSMHFDIELINKEKKLYNLKHKKLKYQKLLYQLIRFTPDKIINVLQKYYGSVIILCKKKI